MGQENRLLGADDNPLRDYMQGRQQDYNRSYYDNGLSAALQGLAAIITPAAFGASLPGLAQAIYFGGNAIRNLTDMQQAGQNFDMAGRGAQMWSGTGMPSRPNPDPNINRLLQGN